MASGRKNYFRHSFFARNDLKLRLLRDEIGVGFYFYYFSLLELCGEESAEDFKGKFVFHNSIIRNLWGVNLKKSERIATAMHSVGLLLFEKQEKTFSFIIPKFLKFLGKYTNKIESKGPNKIKENKIKRNKIKEKEIKELTIKKSAKPKGPLPDIFTAKILENVTHEIQKEWIKLYQDTDWLKYEFSQMDIWILSNPQKKPKSNFGSFISRWLSNGWEKHRKKIPSNYNSGGLSKAEQIQNKLLAMHSEYNGGKSDT